MPHTITAAELFDEVEIDLWGNLYRLREMTKTVSAKVDEKNDELQKLGENVEDAQAVELLVDLLDVLLEPISENGKPKTKARTVLLAKWKADELGQDRITVLADEIQTAAGERRRPTSQAESDDSST